MEHHLFCSGKTEIICVSVMDSLMININKRNEGTDKVGSTVNKIPSFLRIFLDDAFMLLALNSLIILLVEFQYFC